MKKSILFVSPGSKGKVTPFVSDLENIDWLNHDVIFTKLESYDYYSNKTSIFIRILAKLRLPWDEYKINLRLIKRIKLTKFDYIFIIKGNLIRPRTLKKIKNISRESKIISWCSDDMMQAHNSSYFYLMSLKNYDLVATTKSFNALPNELPKYGAKRTLFQDNSYIKAIHRPLIREESNITNSDVLFIGFAEKERFHSMNYLAKNGIKVDIYGSGWEKSYYQLNADKNLNINPKNLDGDDYSEAISRANICLCFLRKINRDLQTARSVEIPACGTLMLAERTDEHETMFKNNIEAVYFSSDRELLDQVKYLNNNPKIRDQIAQNGYERCMKSKMSYPDRLKVIIENTS